MNELTLADLNKRLERVEKRMRRWRYASLFLMVTLIIAGVTLKTLLWNDVISRAVIKAQEFEVIGQDGKVKATLGPSGEPNGPTALKFVFVSFPIGSEQLYGEKSVEGLGSSVELNAFGMTFYDQNEHRFSYFTSAGTFQPPGQISLPLAAQLSAGDVTATSDLQAGELISGRWTDITSDSVTVMDNFKQRAVLGVVETENPKTGATTTSAPSALTLFDKNGDVIWHDPY